MDNVWMMPVSVRQAGKAPDVIWRHVVNVVKANVSTAVVFVIMASMANIVALMLVGLIAILMEFVKICLKRINDRNMSKFFAAESNVKKNSRLLGIFDYIFFAIRLWTFSTVCAKIQRIDGRKKWRHFSLLIAGANASPDGRVSIAKSPKRWTVRMKWTMIIVSIAGLNALKMHALFPSLLLYIIFGSDMVLDQLF